MISRSLYRDAYLQTRFSASITSANGSPANGIIYF